MPGTHIGEAEMFDACNVAVKMARITMEEIIALTETYLRPPSVERPSTIIPAAVWEITRLFVSRKAQAEAGPSVRVLRKRKRRKEGGGNYVMLMLVM